MMMCGRCNTKNPNFSLYCEHCGAQLAEEKKAEAPALQPNESTAELKSYILECMAAGHGMTQIKRALQREGYNDQEIQQAFVKAHEVKEPPKPKVEHHPLAQHQPQNDTSKHTAMMFIALVAVVLVGGGLMWNAQQETMQGFATFVAQGSAEKSMEELQRLQYEELIETVNKRIDAQGETYVVKLDQQVAAVNELVASLQESEEVQFEERPAFLEQEMQPYEEPLVVGGRPQQRVYETSSLYQGGSVSPQPKIVQDVEDTSSAQKEQSVSFDTIPGGVKGEINAFPKARLGGPDVNTIEQTTTLPIEDQIFITQIHWKKTSFGVVLTGLDTVVATKEYYRPVSLEVKVFEEGNAVPIHESIELQGDKVAGLQHVYTDFNGRGEKEPASQRGLLAFKEGQEKTFIVTVDLRYEGVAPSVSITSAAVKTSPPVFT